MPILCVYGVCVFSRVPIMPEVPLQPAGGGPTVVGLMLAVDIIEVSVQHSYIYSALCAVHTYVCTYVRTYHL